MNWTTSATAQCQDRLGTSGSRTSRTSHTSRTSRTSSPHSSAMTEQPELESLNLGMSKTPMFFDQSKISWGTICYDLLGGWGFPSIWLRARPSLVLSILCARNLGIWVFWIFLDSTWPHKIIYRWTLLTSCSYAISRWESIKGPQHSNSLLQGSLSEKNDLIWEVEHLMVQQSLEQQMNSRHTIKMMAIMHDSESIWNVGLWRLQLRNIRSEFF